MNKKVILIPVLAIIIFSIIFYLYNPPEKTSFEVTPLLLKIILDKNETASSTLDIKNLGTDDIFSVKTENLNGTVFLDQTILNIAKEESGAINVNISGINASYGVHIGHISISNSIEEKKIPVIISVHTANQIFAININVAPENRQLEKNDNVIADIKLFNLYDIGPHSIRINYKIFDIYGGEIFSESEELTLSSKAAITKKFPLPKEINIGDYVFAVSLNYLDTVTTSSYLFSVTDKKNFFNINTLALIIAISVLIILFLILYMLHERNSLFYNLKKQHRSQLNSFFNSISREKKNYLAKAKTQKQKKKIVGEIQNAKEKILNELKKRQKKQLKELKTLKKENAEQKMRQWKKESYLKALDAVQIRGDLKNKLATLKNAYSQGFINKTAYGKGVSKIKSANRRLKRNVYK